MNDQERLNQVLNNTKELVAPRENVRTPQPQAENDKSSERAISVHFSQWQIESNNRFRPAGQNCPTIPPGVYSFDKDAFGIYLAKLNVLSDYLIELDDSASSKVLGGIRQFWTSESEYTKRGIIYKRGILIWGPAGSGKTALIVRLSQELIHAGGIVILVGYIPLVSTGLRFLRMIEPTRQIILIMEDIDEIVNIQGEHELLALLDGETQISNVVSIATTNFPERLGARIVNRPSRFDERIFVDMPNEVARTKYLQWATRHEIMNQLDMKEWIRDTAGFSVAHLRELVVAVFCLKQPYREVLDRLRNLTIQPKSKNEFAGHIGIGRGTGKTIVNVSASSSKP